MYFFGNFGRSGLTTEGFKAQFTKIRSELEQFDPDIVLIQLGGNDITVAGEIGQGLLEIWRRVCKIYPFKYLGEVLHRWDRHPKYPVG